jgi:acyl carrier protein
MSPDILDLVRRTIRGIAPEADVDAIDPDGPLAPQLDLDSMDVVTLMERLQEATGLVIPDRDSSQLQSLRDLVTYLRARVG